MPEELNRVITDQLADALFIHSPEARENLIREGVDSTSIHFVGKHDDRHARQASRP